MGLCNSCCSIRLGNHNTGDTLIEALDKALNIGTTTFSAGSEKFKTLITQANERGACKRCIGILHSNHLSFQLVNNEIQQLLNRNFK